VAVEIPHVDQLHCRVSKFGGMRYEGEARVRVQKVAYMIKKRARPLVEGFCSIPNYLCLSLRLDLLLNLRLTLHFLLVF
jgi:hypothetical protein